MCGPASCAGPRNKYVRCERFQEYAQLLKAATANAAYTAVSSKPGCRQEASVWRCASNLFRIQLTAISSMHFAAITSLSTAELGEPSVALCRLKTNRRHHIFFSHAPQLQQGFFALFRVLPETTTRLHCMWKERASTLICLPCGLRTLMRILVRIASDKALRGGGGVTLVH